MNKTLVINGPEGTGKTLLARATARKTGSYVTTTLDRVLAGLLPRPGAKARTVIVEEIDGTDPDQRDQMKALVTSPTLQVKGDNPQPTPNFIFVTQARNPLKLGANERRFRVRDLTEVLTPEQARELAVVRRSSPLKFDYWHNLYADDLAIAWAETGRDREGCFDLGRETEAAYDTYVASFGGGSDA